MAYRLHHSTRLQCSPGDNDPLGACLQPGGVNFAFYSSRANEVYLLLFPEIDKDPTDIIRIKNRTDNVWHVFIHGIREGQLYGYKVIGPYSPEYGQRCNEYKLLIDPYTKAISGNLHEPGPFFGYDRNSKRKDLAMDTLDNTREVPKSMVIKDDFDWQGIGHPGLSYEELVLYEVHVRGFTRHRSSGVHQAGTYLGLLEKIPYLKDLGVNAVELLPVYQYCTGEHLIKNGLSEYWGYNTICFFAPELRYSTRGFPGCQVTEFKTMVRELHRAGIEVILDVVYNHTGEGNELGPTYLFKGIDNPTYYILTGTPEEPGRFYVNDSGCGNTINSEHPQVLRLIMDSLRYWTEIMQVDGFRFDLAPVLAREKGIYDRNSAFFKAIYQDPVLHKVKMIAEPWDLKSNQIGNFPQKWSEWNGKFRKTVRRFLRGDKDQVKDLAWRLTGSADLYEINTKYPYNSINFITCHDGFTLYDLFSYNTKHNELNRENNRDGPDRNYSWNCGIEGRTADPEIVHLRHRMIKNGLCLLFFSLGTPMLLGGDEMGRTQQGNNNPYCQDNEISWFNWEMLNLYKDIYLFCKKAIACRKRYTILYKKRFYSGKDGDMDTVPDILWFDENLTTPAWQNPDLNILCYQIDGSEVPSDLGNYHLFFILNMGATACKIRIPQYYGMKWFRVVDTSLLPGDDFCEPGNEELLPNQAGYQASAFSVVVLLGQEG